MINIDSIYSIVRIELSNGVEKYLDLHQIVDFIILHHNRGIKLGESRC